MLFNSYEFLFCFFPVVLILYFLLGRLEHNAPRQIMLIAASLVFYGWLNPSYVFIIISSILVNYAVMLLLFRDFSDTVRKCILTGGIVFNVLLIGYFKYYDFFISNLNTLFKTDFALKYIALPLGISFYTFQQIGFIVDAYRKTSEKYPLLDYALFVTFFPQLVAGPIVKHSEIIPQFRDAKSRRLNIDNLMNGFLLISFGLAKKVLLADTLALEVNWYWSNMEAASSADAWLAVIIYTLEIYFDFSGYCDMASGIASCMNIKLPINFNKPYIATSIVDFWSRWHMTLTRFLREYIYFPLGGNRKGRLRTCLNIMIVFLISGLWHGANWTFVLWGALHGLLNVFERLTGRFRERIPRIITGAFTFVFVNLTWVLFRAPSLSAAFDTYKKLTGSDFTVNSFMLMNYYLIDFKFLDRTVFSSDPYLYNMLFILIIGLLMALVPKPVNRPEEKKPVTLCIAGVLLVWSVLSLSIGGTFIYFNF